MAQPAYRDEDVLRELYWEKGLNIKEIGEELGCNKDTVHRWMKRNGVERETAPQNKPVHHRFDEDGYERWRHDTNGTQYKVSVHRLQMVAEEGIEAVKGMEVHHKNRMPRDNRPSNLELVTPEEHREITGEQRKVDAANISDEKLREYIYGKEMSINDIADKEHCKKLAVKRCLNDSSVWNRFIPHLDGEIVSYVVENNSIEFAVYHFDLTEHTIKQRLRSVGRCDLAPDGRGLRKDKYDKEKLRKLYHEDSYSMKEVAQEMGISQGAVSQTFDKFGIETRSRGPQGATEDTVAGSDLEQPWRHEDILYKEYVEKGNGRGSLSEAWGCNPKTVRRWVENFGFEKHDSTDHDEKPWQEEDTLNELYVEKDMTMQEVADELGCSAATIKKWLDRHGIAT